MSPEVLYMRRSRAFIIEPAEIGGQVSERLQDMHCSHEPAQDSPGPQSRISAGRRQVRLPV